MMYSATIFKSPRWWEEQQRFVYDNKTHRRIEIETWDGFVKFFYKMAERKLNGKQNAELISPAIYEAGTTRSNKNVLAWAGWAAVDIDDWQFEGELKDELSSRLFEGELKDELNRRFPDWSYICYSTASSTANQPKFRLVFQLNRHIPMSEIKHFWFALQSALDDAGDKQCKDLCRMYYTPADYLGSNNFIWHNNGAPIDVDALFQRYPYSEKLGSANFLDRLPDAWREQVIAHRKSSLDNTDIVWTSYHDCPFWPKKLAVEYQTISSTGWYRQMYRIMIAVAGKAIEKKYPINAVQIVELCRQFDIDTGNWYENRPMQVEANNALEYAYRNGVV
jgi:hypothetical protein